MCEENFKPKANLVFLFQIFSIILLFNLSQSQTLGTEFPIETGQDSTFATGFAEDNFKYAIVMRRERGSGAEIVVQFHSKIDHSLVGNPIVLGTTSIPKENFEEALPQIAFDGNRFLVIWTDGENGGIKYRFIDAQTFALSGLYSDATLPCYLAGINILHYNSNLNKYFLVSEIRSASGYYLIYNFIRPDGYLENSNQVSGIPCRKEYSVAYGNSKYLVSFVKESGDYDPEVYGQFLSENGSLIGSTFLIDGSPEPSDDPVYVAYDGSKFISLFPDEESTGWKVYARIIQSDGTVQQGRYLISENGWLVPFAILGENKVLVTTTKVSINPDSCFVRGKFFDLSLNPLGSEFTVFRQLSGKIPIGGVGAYVNGKFYVYTTRVNLGFTNQGGMYIVNGDIYGVSISYVTGVENTEDVPRTFTLKQNYPNPFNPTTTIEFEIPERVNVKLIVYDILAREISTLVDKELEPGKYKVDFDAKNLPSGVYFYRLEAGKFASVKKMVLVR
jgi:hypothetical protein